MRVNKIVSVVFLSSVTKYHRTRMPRITCVTCACAGTELSRHARTRAHIAGGDQYRHGGISGGATSHGATVHGRRLRRRGKWHATFFAGRRRGQVSRIVPNGPSAQDRTSGTTRSSLTGRAWKSAGLARGRWTDRRTVTRCAGTTINNHGEVCSRRLL